MGDDTTRFSSEPPLIPVKCSAPTSGPKIMERVVSSEEEKNGDVNLSTDLESVVSLEEDIEIMIPGMWRYPTILQHCCIYRVPKSIRDVKPEAYTPQLLLIGPLHHSLKSQVLMSNLNDTRNTKFMGYLNMEQHKKRYFKAFSQRVNDENVINEFKRVIKENEGTIRANYSESTTWIKSQEFVEMILHDSVFILEFVLRFTEISMNKRGDVLMDEPTILGQVYEDLILLENQLPYFILQKLFDPIVPKLRSHYTFRDLIIIYFGLKGKIKHDTEFKHFTDLFRCARARVETLMLTKESSKSEHHSVQYIYNVEKLEHAGVKFEVLDTESLEVRFEKGCLKLPSISVDEHLEMRLRNLIAFEQCHYPYEAYVCGFVIFLDHLIHTHKDVDILVENGIIRNWMGHSGYMTEMVNKLSMGVYLGSYYYNYYNYYIYYNHAAVQANAYRNNRINRARAISKRARATLKRARAILRPLYFNNLWTGTATVAAVFLLLMTLIQTVISVMQVI